jgi:hypothetical protein
MDVNALLTITGQVSKRKGSLALNLETLTVHQSDQTLHELWLGCRQFLSIVAYYEPSHQQFSPSTAILLNAVVQ